MSIKEYCEGLLKAIESGRTDVVRSVISTLQKSSDENELMTVLNDFVSEDGTLLHIATKLDQSDIVRILLSAGADPGIQNNDHRIPMDFAKSMKVKAVYNEELLQATSHSNMGRVCQLLASGLDVNLKDCSDRENTPLHWAATYGSRDMIQCLCSRGANVNATNKDGCTPLHEAVSRDNLAVVDELLMHKADPSIKITSGTNKGKSAFALADRNSPMFIRMQNPPNKNDRVKKPLPETITDDFVVSAVSVNQNSDMNLSEIDTATEFEESIYNKQTGLLSFSRKEDVSTQVKGAECLSFLAHSAVTEPLLSFLWPRPKSIVEKEGNPFIPDEDLYIYLSTLSDSKLHSVAQLWNNRQFMFTNVGINMVIALQSSTIEKDRTCIICHINDRLCVEKASYKILIFTSQIKILAHDVSSLSYAIITLSQLFKLYKTESGIHLPLLEISDSPSMSYRGILLDISKGRIPNIETLKCTLDKIAFLKFNQVHLYVQFQTSVNTQSQFSYSFSELLEIDKYCMDLGIQLIPAIDVQDTVNLEDLPFLQAPFKEYVSHFTNSEFINIGLRLASFLFEAHADDTLTMADATKYLPLKDKTLLISNHSTLEENVQLLQQLPPHLMFANYGTKADYNFMPHCKSHAESGFGFFVCPGTAAWSSLAGFPEAAVSNVFNAAKCGNTQSGIGMLVCQWPGNNFLTHLQFCWPGFVTGAGLAWNKDVQWEFLHFNLAELMNHHIFGDTTAVFGQVIIELGRIETYIFRCSQKSADDEQCSIPCENSTLASFITQPDETKIEDLTSDILQRANRHLRKHQNDVTGVQLNCAQAKEIISEVLLTTDMMILALKIGRAMITAGRNPDPQSGLRVVNLGIANLTATGKTDLANRLLELIENFSVCWKQRYVPKFGLPEIKKTLQNVLTQLIPNEEAEKISAII
ncbi:uncharacterized protein LOC115214018 isoform X1 [Argonauta hians]